MCARPLVAAAFVFTLHTIAAPQDLPAAVSIQVVDTQGARIPAATVQVVSSDGLISSIHLDNAGQAMINLPSGTYEVRASSVGFQRKTEKVSLAGRAGQVLEIKLAIDPKQGGYSGPVVDSLIIPEEHAAPLVQLPSPEVPLKVMVKDLSGQFIPRAVIQIRSSESGVTAEGMSDAQGNATMPLEPGIYSVSVAARGFAKWSSKVDLQPSASQSLLAELRVGGGGGIEVTPIDSGIETERQILDVSIPFEPVESLMDLPAHKMRRPKWPHHAQS